MRVTTSTRSAAIMLVAGLWLCQPSLASLGLGEARIQSFLGQKLDVDIALVHSGETEVDSLQVAVATAAEHARLGVPSEALVLGLSVVLDQTVNPPLIRLRSERPVDAPFLQVLIDARWASGRLLREYTLFIDPPTVPVAPPIRRPQEPATGPAETRAAAGLPDERAREISELTVPDNAPMAEAAPVGTGPEQSGAAGPASDPDPDPVPARLRSRVAERGDTLWSIAADWRGNGDVTMHQAMMAIFERNPEAFMGNNVNRLRRGARVILPTPDQALALSPEEASRRIAAQASAWEAGQTAPARAQPEEPAAPELPLEDTATEPDLPAEQSEALMPETEADSSAADASIDQTVADQAAEEQTSETPSQPRLQLTPPDEEMLPETAAIAAERDRLSLELADIEAQIVQEGLEGPEIDTLVDQARQAIESADVGGMLVASEDLARLEEQLREARQARQAEQEIAATTENTIVTEPLAPSADALPRAPQASFLERWMWPLIGAAAALLLLIALIVRRQRRSTIEQGPVASQMDQETAGRAAAPGDQTSAVKASSEAGETALTAVDDDPEAALMGILDREDEGDDLSTSDTDLESALDESDDAATEDTATDIARRSDRQDAAEIESPEPALPTPETLALEEDDYEALFAEDAESSVESDAGEEESEPLTLDFELPEDEPGQDAVDGAEGSTGSAQDVPTGPGPDAPADDMTDELTKDDLSESSALDLPDPLSEPDAESSDGEGLEITRETSVDAADLGDLDAEISPFEIENEPTDDRSTQDQLDEREWFDLEDNDDTADTARGATDEPIADRDVQSGDDPPAQATAGLADEDAEVKLDLARAYISMEDRDSARVLIDEVISDGSPNHREQAQKLLDSLR